jgi:ABC-type oligopeptide transport system ATPase subunit
MTNENLIEVKNLTKHFPTGGGLFSKGKDVVKAVDGVSFTIRKGETFGLVGESGCGKSTTGRCILRLIEPSAGEVRFGGEDLLSVDSRSLRQMRRDMQIIFQDPYSSLNPSSASRSSSTKWARRPSAPTASKNC